MKIRFPEATLLSLFFIQQVVAEVIVDGSIGGTIKNISGPDYAISDDLGQQQGANVFHSFSKFNIYSGEKAHFFTSIETKNILARITDHESSFIDGEIISKSAANLWLMNPAGWVVGQNAKLDFNGAFHLSTAHGIGFGNGDMFFADPVSQSVLSAAPPVDYQFNQGVQSKITLDQADLVLLDKQDISLIGGDIKMQNSSINAPGGRILIASNSGAGTWYLDKTGFIQLEGQRGIIDIEHDTQQSTASLSGLGIINELSSGTIQLTAKQINLKNAFIDSRSWNNNLTGDTRLQAEQIILDSSTISTGVQGTIDAGKMQINAQDLILNKSEIISNTRPFTTGIGGDISLNLTGRLSLDDSNITSTALGNKAGNIQLHAETISLNDQSKIAVTTQRDGGNAGDLNIIAKQFNINNLSSLDSSSLGDATLASNLSLAKGQGGKITVSADKLSLSNGLISSASLFSEGDAGDITIQTSKLSLANKSEIRAASIGGTGKTAKIELSINGALIMDKSSINTFALETDGGPIQLASQALVLNHSEIITSSLGEQGDGGNILVDTDTLIMNGGFIQGNATAINARGGDIQINADNTSASQEDILVGGDQRQQFDLKVSDNVIQAAAPDGVSGRVNLNSVELNIAGQLAKVDSNFASRKNIADDPCRVSRDEQMSSLVKLGQGSLPKKADDNINLPLHRHLPLEKKQPKQQHDSSIDKISKAALVLCQQNP